MLRSYTFVGGKRSPDFWKPPASKSIEIDLDLRHTKKNTMSHTRVKTTYSTEGAYGSTETRSLYCDHNHSTDYVVFYQEDGSVAQMIFGEWETGNDLWDAMNRLWFPYLGEWGRSPLKPGVEHYVKGHWEK